MTPWADRSTRLPRPPIRQLPDVHPLRRPRSRPRTTRVPACTAHRSKETRPRSESELPWPARVLSTTQPRSRRHGIQYGANSSSSTGRQYAASAERDEPRAPGDGATRGRGEAMKGVSFKAGSAPSAKKVAMPSAPKVHPAARTKVQVRFPDSGAVGAAPAVQTPVGRI